jgi:hypothetical protein
MIINRLAAVAEGQPVINSEPDLHTFISRGVVYQAATQLGIYGSADGDWLDMEDFFADGLGDDEGPSCPKQVGEVRHAGYRDDGLLIYRSFYAWVYRVHNLLAAKQSWKCSATFFRYSWVDVA